MALAIDGSAHTNGSGSTNSATLTTTSANDYILACITTNGGPVTGVSGATLGAFTLVSRKPTQFGGPAQEVSVWAKFSSSALTSEVITATNTSGSFTTIDVFGVSGSGQTSLVFDTGGPQTAFVDPISITTASAATMVIAGYREGSAASPTAGSGFTTVHGGDFQLVEYQVLSSAQTLSCTQTTGNGTANAGIVFAIVQAGGGGAAFLAAANIPILQAVKRAAYW